MKKLDTKNKLPKWFTGECYTHGSIVQNRFSGEEYELSATELSMYDYIMGNVTMMELGMMDLDKNYHKGLDWFRETNPDAYFALLD